ncbi:MAG TPA: alanine racemase [Acidimicrobiia bacterium]|nr:alanine racemase [Acidimicrobiia bacterium]
MNSQEDVNQYRPSVISISFDALEHNIRTIKELVKPALLAIPIKANAYGHGILPLARKLSDLDVDMFCVATVEEALLLRENGITTSIFLLSEPPRDAIEPCYQADVTFTVYTTGTIDMLASVATSNKPAHVHLKVDTGMNRVGMEPQDTLDFIQRIIGHKTLFFEGLYTHFATAEDAEHPLCDIQLERFEHVLEVVESAGLTPPLIHAANSGAALRLATTRFSMVRVGLSTYGVYPHPSYAELIDLRLVLSLTTKISFVKNAYVGETISYGARYEVKKDTRIATLPLGYGDGVPRNLGLLGGSVIVQGSRCPVVGAVTMDQMMIDVGDLPVSVGDKVTLLGTDGDITISPVEWADLLGTISYEILCALGERLDRSYD